MWLAAALGVVIVNGAAARGDGSTGERRELDRPPCLALPTAFCLTDLERLIEEVLPCAACDAGMRRAHSTYLRGVELVQRAAADDAMTMQTVSDHPDTTWDEFVELHGWMASVLCDRAARMERLRRDLRGRLEDVCERCAGSSVEDFLRRWRIDHLATPDRRRGLNTSVDLTHVPDLRAILRDLEASNPSAWTVLDRVYPATNGTPATLRSWIHSVIVKAEIVVDDFCLSNHLERRCVAEYLAATTSQCDCEGAERLAARQRSLGWHRGVFGPIHSASGLISRRLVMEGVPVLAGDFEARVESAIWPESSRVSRLESIADFLAPLGLTPDTFKEVAARVAEAIEDGEACRTRLYASLDEDPSIGWALASACGEVLPADPDRADPYRLDGTVIHPRNVRRWRPGKYEPPPTGEYEQILSRWKRRHMRQLDDILDLLTREQLLMFQRVVSASGAIICEPRFSLESSAVLLTRLGFRDLPSIAGLED